MITLEDKYMARTRQFRYHGYTVVATCTRDNEYYGEDLFFPVIEVYKGKKYIKGKVLNQPLSSPTQSFRQEEKEGRLLIDSLK